jgi:hypothetical protein
MYVCRDRKCLICYGLLDSERRTEHVACLCKFSRVITVAAVCKLFLDILPKSGVEPLPGAWLPVWLSEVYLYACKAEYCVSSAHVLVSV